MEETDHAHWEDPVSTAVAMLPCTPQSWPPLPDDGTEGKSMSLPVGVGKPPALPPHGGSRPTTEHPASPYWPGSGLFAPSGPSDKLPVAKVGIMWTRNKIES